jgi:Clp amino terminal domain, pathogenicity island component
MTLDELISQVKTRRPDGTALDHLAEAAELAGFIDELADHLVGHFVDQARRSGASWTAIGQSMGVTKQAVQQRFVAGEISLERFTNRARVVVLKAQTGARERGDQEVTSLHLVWGLLAEWEGFAGQAIEAAGVSKEVLERSITDALSTPGTPARVQAAFSPGLNKVFELSVREALRLGHNYVGTEHLLLGLLEARDEAGTRVLTDLGVSKAATEAWTLQALAQLA